MGCIGKEESQKGVFNVLVAAGFDGYSTLEVAGDAAVKQSYEFLKSLGAE